jgi:hypothetical protein
MTNEKKLLLTIPRELNKKINLHLIKIRDQGIEITKAKLCIQLIEGGLLNRVKIYERDNLVGALPSPHKRGQGMH